MSSIVIAGDTSGSVTLQAPAVAGSTVITLPSTSTTLVSSQWTTTGSDIYYNTGNVGIGTSSPSASDWNASATVVQVSKNDTNGGLFKASSSNTNFVFSAGNNLAYIATTTNTPILFYTNTTERARIDSSGNFGVGTSSPSSYGGSAFTKSVNIGSLNTVTAGFSDEVSGTFRIAHASGQNILNFDTSALCFQSGGSTPTERARIDSSGNLMVGKTATGGSTPGFEVKKVDATTTTLLVTTAGYYNAIFNRQSDNGDSILFQRQNSVVGSISVTTTATAYNTSSDYRLKNTIAPMTGALSKVALLKPCTYKWNADSSDGEGFIAHEIAEVMPHAVTGEKDAVDADGKPVYQGIDTSFLVATLTAAIQEQQALITALTERITALEGV